MHKNIRQAVLSFSAVALAATLSSCRLLNQLGNVGEQPPLSTIENPEKEPNYKPVTMPMPIPKPVHAEPNSLWQSGSKGFFKDQRANQVGDILTVTISINDSANTTNTTKRNRDNTEDLSVTNLFGKEKKLSKYIGGVAGGAAKALDIIGKPDTEGKGSIVRSETVNLKVAAIITQILPNGNYVIQGRQEVLINFERRDLYIRGIVRPQDITSDNTISYEKIAEARINYGGEGHIMHFQQPPWGSQVIDILSPF